MAKEWNVPPKASFLLHRGQVVYPMSSLADQGFVDGSNVMLIIRAMGGGKDDGSDLSFKGAVICGNDH